MEQGYITTDDGVKLFHQRIGDADSTVIIPNALLLFDYFKYLASDHTLIFYDMRNRGQSDAVRDPDKLSRGIHQDVLDLEAVRRHFDIEKINLIGHSYLGLMVFLYASVYHAHVNRLVQIGPAQFNPAQTYPPHLRAGDKKPVIAPEKMEELKKLEQSGYAETNPVEHSKKWYAVNSAIYVSKPEKTAELFSKIAEYPNERPANITKHYMENLIPSIHKLALKEEQIGDYSQPVLTIHGTEDIPSPYGAGREWAKSLRNARLLTIKGGSHFPWVESPEIVFSSIRTFLNGGWPDRAEKVESVDFINAEQGQ